MKNDIFKSLQPEKVDMNKLWKAFNKLHNWSEDQYEAVETYCFTGGFPNLPTVERMNGGYILFITANQWQLLEKDLSNIQYVDEIWTRNPHRPDEDFHLECSYNEEELDEIFIFGEEPEMIFF